MPFQQTRQGKVLLAGFNLSLFLLALFLGIKAAHPEKVQAPELSSTALLQSRTLRAEGFAARKNPLALSDLLMGSQSFIAQFDARPKPRPMVEAPRLHQEVIPAALKSQSSGPKYDWEELRLVGVVINKRGGRYAIIESLNGKRQLLLSEGQRLQEGAVLQKIDSESVVLEAFGETRVLRLVPSKPTGQPTPRRRPLIAESRRDF